jgi:hypothetical protein
MVGLVVELTKMGFARLFPAVPESPPQAEPMADRRRAARRRMRMGGLTEEVDEDGR